MQAAPSVRHRYGLQLRALLGTVVSNSFGTVLAPPGDGVNVVVVGGSHSLSCSGIWPTIGLSDSSYSSLRKYSCSNLKRLSHALSRGMSAGRDFKDYMVLGRGLSHIHIQYQWD